MCIYIGSQHIDAEYSTRDPLQEQQALLTTESFPGNFSLFPCGYLHSPLTSISLQIQVNVANIPTSGEGSEVKDCEDLIWQVKARECFLRGIIELSGQEGGIFPQA